MTTRDLSEAERERQPRPTYADVNEAWGEEIDLPPLAVADAMIYAARLSKRFGGGTSPWYGATRRAWGSTKTTRNSRSAGWRRMVHAVSHWCHLKTHNGKLLDHSHVHAAMELEMIRYVLRKGWATPKPKKVKAIPTPDERRAAVAERIKRWETKAKRAATALKKLRAKERRLHRASVKAHETGLSLAP